MLPRGRVWHRGWGTIQTEHIQTLFRTWASLHRRINDVITETFPCTTYELLPEWESSLGLPDPCTGPLDTIQQRQSAVCAKFAERGGQSIDYFIALARALGYEINIEVFTPFRASQNRVGDRLRNEDWAFAWRVTVHQVLSIVWFRASVSAVGERLATFGDSLLKCEFEQRKPLHTVIIWRVGDAPPPTYWDNGLGPGTVWDSGASIWDDIGYPLNAGAEQVGVIP